MLLQQAYKADHSENRMKHEGDVARAREHFFSNKSHNLRQLLAKRFEWMNTFISPDSRGLEVGCGTGVSKEFIKAREYIVSDFADHP